MHSMPMPETDAARVDDSMIVRTKVNVASSMDGPTIAAGGAGAAAVVVEG